MAWPDQSNVSNVVSMAVGQDEARRCSVVVPLLSPLSSKIVFERRAGRGRRRRLDRDTFRRLFRLSGRAWKLEEAEASDPRVTKDSFETWLRGVVEDVLE